jgi:hypothetical protein
MEGVSLFRGRLANIAMDLRIIGEERGGMKSLGVRKAEAKC